MKQIKIYADILEDEALKQFNDAMKLQCNEAGALMSDAHSGYTLPIGAVVRSKNMIFPAYVGYDIGCGMCAVKLDLKAGELDLERVKDEILREIPVGIFKHLKPQEFANLPKCTEMALNLFSEIGAFQLGTLGSGNHFIEIGKDKASQIWVIVHSGSRGFGKSIAEFYMKLACEKSLNSDKFVAEFEAKNAEFKKHNPSKFEIAKQEFVKKSLQMAVKSNLEGHYGFELNSKEAKDYILDMNCAMEFALENRKIMIEKIKQILGNPKELFFINKHHNHAIVDANGYVLHRKGATSANLGEYGVIPGNMRDGSFIVRGLGNENSLCSSSHGAGRVLSRAKAKATLSVNEFFESMKGIVTNHTENMLDEAPKAYKDIFEVMKSQSDLVEIVEHIKPILNVKG